MVPELGACADPAVERPLLFFQRAEHQVLQKLYHACIILILGKIGQRWQVLFEEKLVVRHLEQGARQRTRVLIGGIVFVENGSDARAQVFIGFEELVFVVLDHMPGEVRLTALGNGHLVQLIPVDMAEGKMVRELKGKEPDHHQDLLLWRPYIVGMVYQLILHPGPQPGDEIGKQLVFILEITVDAGLCSANLRRQLPERKIFEPDLVDHADTVLNDVAAERR